jgi:hypothetical protein
MIFPFDAITKTIVTSGTQTTYIETGNASRTILAVQTTQSNLASNTDIKCGTTEILTNFAKDTQFHLSQFRCAGDLFIVKTGNDTSQTVITYINRDIAIDATTSTQRVAAGFTYGEVINGIFLFLILSACTAIAFRLFFQKVRTKIKIKRGQWIS